MVSPPPRGGVNRNGTGYSVVTEPQVFSSSEQKRSASCSHFAFVTGYRGLCSSLPRTQVDGAAPIWNVAGCAVIPSMTLEVTRISLLATHWPEQSTWPQRTTRETGGALLSRDWKAVDPELSANSSNDI